MSEPAGGDLIALWIACVHEPPTPTELAVAKAAELPACWQGTELSLPLQPPRDLHPLVIATSEAELSWSGSGGSAYVLDVADGAAVLSCEGPNCDPMLPCHVPIGPVRTLPGAAACPPGTGLPTSGGARLTVDAVSCARGGAFVPDVGLCSAAARIALDDGSVLGWTFQSAGEWLSCTGPACTGLGLSAEPCFIAHNAEAPPDLGAITIHRQ